MKILINLCIYLQNSLKLGDFPKRKENQGSFSSLFQVLYKKRAHSELNAVGISFLRNFLYKYIKIIVRFLTFCKRLERTRKYFKICRNQLIFGV